MMQLLFAKNDIGVFCTGNFYIRYLKHKLSDFGVVTFKNQDDYNYALSIVKLQYNDYSNYFFNVLGFPEYKSSFEENKNSLNFETNICIDIILQNITFLPLFKQTEELQIAILEKMGWVGSVVIEPINNTVQDYLKIAERKPIITKDMIRKYIPKDT